MTDWTIDEPDPLVLIACSARKAGHACPARELYRGDLFRLSVTWAESWDLSWCVLSALHGVVEPDQTLAPYDTRLRSRLDGYAFDALAHTVHNDLAGRNPGSVVVLGGKDYVAVARKATPDHVPFWAPLQDIHPGGLGRYKRWLRQNLRNVSPDPAVAE